MVRTMHDLREQLDQRAERLSPVPDALDRVLSRARKRQRTRRMGSALLALSVFAVALGGLWVAFRASERPVPATDEKAVVTARIPLDRGTTDVAVGDGAVWVPTAGGELVRIDPATDSVVAEISVPGLAGDDLASVAVGEGAVWVTTSKDVVRVDPATNEVRARIQVGCCLWDVTTGGGAVWVSRPQEGHGTVLRIDPATNSVLDEVRVGFGPGPIVYGNGAVWVSNTSFGAPAVMRIDAETGEVRPVRVIDQPGALAFGAGSLWRASSDTVVRVDPETSTLAAEVWMPRAADLSFANGWLWVLTATGSTSETLYLPDPNAPATVVRIDPATNRTVGDPVAIGITPAHLAAGDGSAWVAHYDSGILTRIDLCAYPCRPSALAERRVESLRRLLLKLRAQMQALSVQQQLIAASIELNLELKRMSSDGKDRRTLTERIRGLKVQAAQIAREIQTLEDRVRAVEQQLERARGRGAAAG